MAKITHIPNRIDREPAVLLGVTAPEFNSITWLALPSFIIATLFFTVLFGGVLAGAFTGLVVALYISFSALLWVARIKRGKPPQWLPHTTAILLEKVGFRAAPFIHKTTYFHSLRDKN